MLVQIDNDRTKTVQIKAEFKGKLFIKIITALFVSVKYLLIILEQDLS